MADLPALREAVAKPTPYYEHAGITIYHGDCRDILPHVTADVVVTDPPYGVGYEYASYEDTTAEYQSVVDTVMGIRPVRGVAVAVAMKSLMRWPQPDWCLCWRKTFSVSRSPFGSGNFELLLWYGVGCHSDRQSDYFEATFQPDQVAADHPCPKPVSWARGVLSITSKSNETILDPFMGSGTTLVAAKQLGRRAIGIEIEERYCEIAVKRLAQEVLPLESSKPEPTQQEFIHD